jgi:hypothetical protein
MRDQTVKSAETLRVIMKRILGMTLIVLSVLIGAILLLFIFGGGLENLIGPKLEGTAADVPDFVAPQQLTVSDTPRVDTNEITIYVDPLTVDLDDSYANTVRDALRLWSQKQPVTFTEVDSEEDADMRVFWVKEFGAEKLGHARGADLIEVGLGDSNCLGEWQAYSYSTVVSIAAHEIGHALGLDHVDDESNVMNSILPTRYQTDAQVSEFLPDDVIKYYPVCAKEPVAKYIISVESDAPLNVYALENEEQEEAITNYDPFTHFVDCEMVEVTSEQRTCIVSDAAVIAVLQPPGAQGSTQFSLTIQESIN